MASGEGNGSEILDLTLEIIRLLIGERCAVVKMAAIDGLFQSLYPPLPGDLSRGQIPASPSVTTEKNKRKKILEVINQVTELLAGETDGAEGSDQYVQVCNEEVITTEVDFQPLYSQEDQEGEILIRVKAEQKEARHEQQLSKEPGANLRVKVERVPLVTGEPEAQVGQIYNIQEALENSVILNIQPALPLADRAVEIPNTEQSPACFEEPSSTKESGLGNSTILRLVIGSEGGWAEDIEVPQRSRIEIESCSDSEAVEPMEDDVSETLPSESNVQDSGSSGEVASVEVEVTPTEGCSKQKTPSQGQECTKSFLCSECGKNFSCKSSLLAHQSVHTGVQQSGDTTDETSASDMNGNRSVQDLSSSGEGCSEKKALKSDRVYLCDECGKFFSYKSSLNAHQRRHIRKRTGLELSGDITDKTSPSDTTNTQDSMSTGEVAPTEGSMVQNTLKCEECGKTFSHKSSLVAHQKRHLIRPLSCSMCDETFTHKGSLKAHERMHSGDLPFTCSECGKGFLKQGPRDIHQRRHRGEKPYVCVDCGNRYAVNGDLISHRRVHTQERPYSCLVCSKSFGNKSNLRRHQNVHTGEKSYVCSTCGKRYAQKQNLLSHQKVHAGDTQATELEAPTKRTLLPQNQQNTNQRIRPKKTYICQVCHKIFGTSSNLSRHRRVHTGEKLFPCLTCGKRYSFKQHLLSHQKVHTGEKKEKKTLAPEVVIVPAQHDDHNY